MQSNQINNVLSVYVVQNERGQYFRAKGYSSSGSTWVDDINKSKIYAKIGPARSVVTWFANEHPTFPILKLLKLTVSNIEVMDETARVEKAKQKKLNDVAMREKRMAEYKLAEAQRQFQMAKDNLTKLKNK